MIENEYEDESDLDALVRIAQSIVSYGLRQENNNGTSSTQR